MTDIPWTRRAVLRAAAAGTAGIAAPFAFGQQARFPQRPIKLIIGFPPGGITDIVMRSAAIEAEKKLGQPVVVENKPGAAGVPAYLAMKSAAPDGYTIGGVNAALWRQPIFEDVAYDPLKDFTYILNMVDNIFAVVVSADSPFHSWADLLAWGRANPDKMSYGAPPGLGQSAHLFVEEITAREKLAWQAIGYKGSSESVTALLGGHINFAVDTVISTSAFVRAGKARYLAVASNHRMKSWPQVPTMKDLGYQLVIDSPIGLGGPAGMPPEIVRALHDGFKFALEQPAFVALLDKSDQAPRYMDTAAFNAFVQQSFVEQRALLTKYGMAKKR
ncbi:tripartite tricarboxylate transporter substrate binding protein [Variovorax sp. KK3]|uniref:tripartite tricarboxylate transporter substrate binding protein n=1 Tax=Variovorax sp. KK3 TaxID=1855728 RepID=UPI0009F9E327|nr:tripartite tricarboxylate transporter substrate binding protein [Variovorax sp. KK3]